MFQSTPLPTGRSDMYRTDALGSGLVSIHAPPNRKERRAKEQGWAAKPGFNPRPSQPEGATKEPPMSNHVVLCFNPRPSQPEGATGDAMPFNWELGEFQSTPLPTGRSDPMS